MAVTLDTVDDLTMQSQRLALVGQLVANALSRGAEPDMGMAAWEGLASILSDASDSMNRAAEVLQEKEVQLASQGEGEPERNPLWPAISDENAAKRAKERRH